ncbi:MAG: hypothetical protein C4K58_00870 [Flavobacteriaceae bacterium]|nr:MAG: hypothetical protein C4K58_00870 [Flavobacteriaceae bacterium]
MTWIYKFSSFIWRIWIALVGFFFAFVLGLSALVLDYFEPLKKYTYLTHEYWGRILLLLSGIRINHSAHPNKNIEKGVSYMLISNHTSEMDIPVCVKLFSGHPLMFVAKKEAEKIPVVGLLLKKFHILVDRSSSESKKAVFDWVEKRLERKGASICIYPEGGVPDDESVVLGEFKIGAFSLAKEHNLPLVVLGIKNMKEKFPFSWTRGKPGVVNTELLEVFYPEDYQNLSPEQLRDKARELLLSYLKK